MVLQRAEDGPLLRQWRNHGRQRELGQAHHSVAKAFLLGVRTGKPRQPEIHQLHLCARRPRAGRRAHSLALRQHDVARLEVTMNDAGAMRAIEGAGDLDSHGKRLVHRHRRRGTRSRAACRARETGSQRLAVEVLHDEEIERQRPRRSRVAWRSSRQSRPAAGVHGRCCAGRRCWARRVTRSPGPRARTACAVPDYSTGAGDHFKGDDAVQRVSRAWQTSPMPGRSNQRDDHLNNRRRVFGARPIGAAQV